jgi:hypothetical protein
MHKKFLKFLLILLVPILFFNTFSIISAQTITQFNNNLYWNVPSTYSSDVKMLQQFLTNQGLYTGPINGSYLTQTYNAVVAFQKANGINPATGYFGPETRTKANAIISSSNTKTTSQTAPSLISSPTPTVTQPAVTQQTVTNTTQTVTNTNQTTVSNDNLISNPSVETANGTKPLNWNNGKWGTNTTTFTYPTTGQDGAKAVKIQMTSYTSGDAKWYFDNITVVPGTTYTFSEYYKSNVVTNVTVRWTSSTGAVTYQSLGNPAAAANWTLRTNNITVPAGVTKMTVFHLLNKVGTLEVDNYKLVSGTSIQSPVLTPVDATVTAWSSWVAVSTWTNCLNNTQTRNEERTRSVINGPVNGGSIPVLKETRTVSQTCGSTTATTTPTLPSTTTPSGTTLNFPVKEWGAYVGWQETALTDFENLVGSQAKHRAVFIHWGNEKNFPTYLKPYVKDKGKTLVVFWEATNYNLGTVNQTGYSYDAILNGNFDAYIAQFASDAKAYGGEVILVPFSEMNGNWFPWSITQNGNSAQKHIDAWRKIREAFRGATNVKFGWAPNHDAVPDTAENQFEKFYPGDAYVDYVGLDGFNFNNPWMTFDQIFGKSLAKMKLYKKPIYIFSFASAQGTQKGAWITDALNVQIPKHPEIKGWIWFNEDKERDWRINSDATALTAFKSVLPLALPL